MRTFVTEIVLDFESRCDKQIIIIIYSAKNEYLTRMDFFSITYSEKYEFPLTAVLAVRNFLVRSKAIYDMRFVSTTDSSIISFLRLRGNLDHRS